MHSTSPLPPIVVIISAATEWHFVTHHLQPVEIHQSPYGEWFPLTILQKELVFIHGGWGKISAAASAQWAILTWSPKYCVNLGTCGGFAGTGVQKGDIILVDETLVYDIVEQMGNPEEAIQAYTTRLDYSWVHTPPGLNVKKHRLISADRDIISSEVPDLINKYQAIAADWESGAIAWVCQKNEVRCLILRGVSDIVDPHQGEAYDNFDVFVAGTARVMSPLLDHLAEWFEGL
jgi:nucleoside phosphorylase